MPSKVFSLFKDYMEEGKSENNGCGIKLLIAGVVLLLLGIVAYDSWLTKEADNYFEACISISTDVKGCQCVADTYYNQQIFRKIFGSEVDMSECEKRLTN